MNSFVFWIWIAVFGVIVVATVYMALRAHVSGENARLKTSESLRDMQLGVVERELASGQIGAKQAEAMRAEVQRAFQRATKKSSDEPSRNGPVWAVWALVAAALLGSLVVYLAFGAPQFDDVPYAEQVEMRNPPQETAYEILAERGQLPAIPPIDEESQKLLDQLEQVVEERPEEAQAWQYLARLSYSSGDFHRAYQSQAEYIRLIGEENAKAEDYTLMAESMVLAVNGYISPEAEAALRKALTIDPSSQVGRYYAALSMVQRGDAENGRALLEGLLAETRDDPNWAPEIERRLTELDGVSGPTAEDIANAEDMSADDRAEMIAGMVDGLSTRLATEGGTPEEWAQLVNALRVLGRDEEADAIRDEAKEIFPDNAIIEALP